LAAAGLPWSFGMAFEMMRQRQMLAAILLTLFLPTASFSQVVPPPHVEPIGPPLFVVSVKGKSGFIDPNGKIVIEPTFEKACPFTDGLAAFQKNEKWGFIDTTGKVVIEPQFAHVGLFSDGMASFQAKHFTDQWGYIDKTGKVVIQPQFDCAEDFRKGIARVGFETFESKLLSRIADVGTMCGYRFIDRTGKFVPDPSPTHYATGEPGELIPFRKNDLAGYLNAKGEVVIEPQFQAGSAFSDGLACVCKEGQFGYIDKRGKWVIPPRFEYANDFSEGLAGVSLGEKGWGFIDRTGKEVIPAKFAWVYKGFRHGVAEVAFDRKVGYVNTKGEWVWKPSE
jgi:WG containing repeat